MTDDVRETTPGERLRASRKAAGLSAEELGRRAGMILGRDRPISPSAVRNQENGTNGIPMVVAQAYGEILKVNERWLVFGDEDESPHEADRIRDSQERAEAKAAWEAKGGWSPQHMRVATFGIISARWLPDMVKPDQTAEDNAIYVMVPGWAESGVPLIAYEVADSLMEPIYPKGCWLICAPEEDAHIWEGMHVIANRVVNGELYQAVREVRSAGPDALDLVGIGVHPQPTSPLIRNGHWAGDAYLDEVVVASVNFVPGSHGPPLRLPEREWGLGHEPGHQARLVRKTVDSEKGSE